MSDKPITSDDVLDMVALLEGDVRLSDLGITGVYCAAVITRWIGLTTVPVYCVLTGGHLGAHDTEGK